MLKTAVMLALAASASGYPWACTSLCKAMRCGCCGKWRCDFIGTSVPH